jgi:hypothetical protein
LSKYINKCCHYVGDPWCHHLCKRHLIYCLWRREGRTDRQRATRIIYLNWGFQQIRMHIIKRTIWHMKMWMSQEVYALLFDVVSSIETYIYYYFSNLIRRVGSRRVDRRGSSDHTRREVSSVQGSKLTFQPASQAGLIDCNLYQSAEKLFSPPHIWKFENWD